MKLKCWHSPGVRLFNSTIIEGNTNKEKFWEDLRWFAYVFSRLEHVEVRKVIVSKQLAKEQDEDQRNLGHRRLCNLTDEIVLNHAQRKLGFT